MKKSIEDYTNPFEAVDEFEKAIAEFVNPNPDKKSLGVIATDSCTHAIELGLRFAMPKMYATIPEQTYLSVPMTLEKLGIEYMYTEVEWDTEYRIEGSIVYDSARQFAPDLFELENPNQKKIVCVSFGHGKPLDIGHGGAIITNSKEAYDWLMLAANDGSYRTITPWSEQKEINVGYHYTMRLEDALIGLNKLSNGDITDLGH